MFRTLAFMLIALYLVQTGCLGSREKELTIIYSGNLNGELEPCGCAEESNQGGIKRRASMVKQLRAEKPDLFLISSGGLLMSGTPQDRLTGKYILKGLAAMDYDALGIQWSDLAFGSDFIEGFKLPWVASNWLGDEFPALRMVERAGLKLAFFTWLDPQTSPERHMAGAEKSVHDDTQAINHAIAKARGDGAVTVLLTTLPLEEVRESISMEEVDILLVQALNEKYSKPQHIGNTLLLQPGMRGMRLGRVDLVVDRNNRIADFSFEVIRLPASVPDDPELEEWYLEYLGQGKEDFMKRSRIRKALISGSSPYMGGEACKGCHAGAYEMWAKSKHAGAYKLLKLVNKDYDPDCIACHTVGFERPGGFVDPVATAHLQNVQCESCHGPCRPHAVSKGAKPVANAGWPPEKICKQCHVGSHSPSFDLERYWPEIEHKKNSDISR
ncbi:MAG: hypothetical protein IMF07_05365 [Proteobacteria bacterium]|nr:hypothetical protein [Pseudomonadota bacterium]